MNEVHAPLIPTPASAAARAPARRLVCLLAAAFVLGAPSAASLAAPGAAALELQVKAAYLYKFAGFTEWPEGSFAQGDSPLTIGVAGHDELAAQLELITAGRSVNGHPVGVRRVKRGEPLTGLHILFVGPLDSAVSAELFGQARSLPLLTVADSANGLAQGAMIAFIMAADRLRFNVGLKPVNMARLRISARMLAVAHQVVPGTPAGAS